MAKTVLFYFIHLEIVFTRMLTQRGQSAQSISYHNHYSEASSCFLSEAMKTHPRNCYVSLSVGNNTLKKKNKTISACARAHTLWNSHSVVLLSSVMEHNIIEDVNHINRLEMCQFDYPFNKYHNHCLIFLCQCDTLKCQITIHDTIRNSCFKVWMDIFVFQLQVMSLHCLVCACVSYLLWVSCGSHWCTICFLTLLLGAWALKYNNGYDVKNVGRTPKTCLSIISLSNNISNHETKSCKRTIVDALELV